MSHFGKAPTFPTIPSLACTRSITDLCLPRGGQVNCSQLLASLSHMSTVAAAAALFNTLVPGLASASDSDFALPFLVTPASCPCLHLSLSPFSQLKFRPLTSSFLVHFLSVQLPLPVGVPCPRFLDVSLSQLGKCTLSATVHRPRAFSSLPPSL